MLNIDCKKKECPGNLYRGGKCYCTQPLKVYDHDYEHLSEGKVIPHGTYDMGANSVALLSYLKGSKKISAIKMMYLKARPECYLAIAKLITAVRRNMKGYSA